MKKGYIAILLLIAIGVLIFILYPSDKKQIKKVLNRCERAIIKEDIGELMENISYSYRDDHGNNYLLIKRRAQIFFDRFNDIGVEKIFKDMTIDGDNAEVLMDARVMANNGGERVYVIGDEIDYKEVRVYLEKIRYRWRINKVDLEF